MDIGCKVKTNALLGQELSTPEGVICDIRKGTKYPYQVEASDGSRRFYALKELDVCNDQ